MNTQITAENFTAAMRAAVAERGADYVYPAEEPGWAAASGACRYSLADGSPACLIGLALHKIDPDYVPGPASFEGADDLLEDFGAPAAVAIAARRAQVEQDNESTWGKALETFERVLKEQS